MRYLLIFVLSFFTQSIFSVSPSYLDPALAKALSDESILKTTRIEISDYPKVLNPSLVAYGDGYLLAFRVTSPYPKVSGRVNPRVDASFIGVVKLDKNFSVDENSVQFLDIESHSAQRSITVEDLRMLSVGGQILVVFNDLPLSKKAGENAIYVAELTENQGEFSLKGRATMLQYDKARIIEKNWSPFVYEDRLCFIYSDAPRVILEADMETGICREVVVAEANYRWNWGRMRGGTPAYFIDGQFLTFFHSVIRSVPLNERGKCPLNYLMGLYAFDAKPPFAIQSLTPPLGRVLDYQHENSRKVVFPGGAVFEKDLVHVAWGKDDRQVIITTFDRGKLMSSMKPCNETFTEAPKPVIDKIVDAFCPNFAAPQPKNR